MSTKGVWLEDLTWPEAKARFAAGRPVVVPVGAIAKEHGFHLPLKTDYVTARGLGQLLADRLDVVVAPVVPFGFYPAFVGYPGSQHLEASTFISLMEELIGNLLDHAVDRIVIVNTGVSTESPLNIVLSNVYRRRAVRIFCAHMRLLGRGADHLLRDRSGGHGDERETSIMLALDARSVRMDRLQPGGDRHEPGSPRDLLARSYRLGEANPGSDEYTATGALGDPSAAEAYKGERILAAMIDELEQAIRAAFPQAFPRN